MDAMAKRGGPQPPRPGTASALRAATAKPTDRPERPTKRVYDAEFKQRVLWELLALGASGDRGAQGAFLRREGLHWATVHRWQADLEASQRSALEPKKRGRKPTKDPLAEENARLRKQLERAQAQLQRAEVIIDVQKKLSALLGLPLPASEDEETP